jgi:hypothetical protein
MGAQRTSTKASSERGVVSRSTNDAIITPPGESLLQHKYRELIRKYLSKLLNALFAEFTGIHFHIAWTLALPRQWDARTLPTGCSMCCRLTGSPLLPECRTCGPRQLARALSADGDGHHFICRLGVHNYWLPIRVRNEMLGIAYLQALENSPVKPPGRETLGSRDARSLPSGRCKSVEPVTIRPGCPVPAAHRPARSERHLE